MVHDGFIHLSLPEYGLKVQGWAAEGPTEGKAKVINPSPARFACGVTKVRRPSGLRLNARPSNQAAQPNGTAAYQRAMALHQRAMAVCNAASLILSVGSGASPSPDTPTRPEWP